MTDAESRKVLALLKAAYPRQEVRPDTLGAYAMMLEDLDAADVLKAVKEHIATSTYFPAISEIRTRCAETTCAAPTAAEAWDEVMRAVASVGQYRLPKWSHPVVGKCVDGIGGWVNLCQSENAVADRSQFMRLYGDERPRAVAKENTAPMLEAQHERALKAQSVGEVLRLVAGAPVTISSQTKVIP